MAPHSQLIFCRCCFQYKAWCVKTKIMPCQLWLGLILKFLATSANRQNTTNQVCQGELFHQIAPSDLVDLKSEEHFPQN